MGGRRCINRLFFLLLIGIVPGACKPRTDSSVASEDSSQSDDSPKGNGGVVNRLIRSYQSALGEDARAKIRRQAGDFFTGLHRRKKLEPLIRHLIDMAPPTKDFTPEKKASTLVTAMEAIDAAITADNRFPSWGDEAINLSGRLMEHRENPDLLGSLASLGGTQWVTYSHMKPLVNGHASWSERKTLMANAKRVIWISSWAFYDDKTGQDAAQALIAKKKAGVDVRIMVDGPTSMKKGYGRPLDRTNPTWGVREEPLEQMQNAGIEVIRWNDPALLGFGLHRKLFIIDPDDAANNALITGGMNYGNEYSHEEPTAKIKDKWRDTDVLLKGQAIVSQAAKAFASVWNEYRSRRTAKGALPSSGNLSMAQCDVCAGNAASEGTSNDVVAYVDHAPSRRFHGEPNYKDPIALVTLKMFASAKRSIDISNSYYIAMPFIQESLMQAMRRGVSVRIHTNSKDAIDDPTLISPIYRGLVALLKEGEKREIKQVGGKFEVGLQQTSTLHSKYMVVDGTYGWVGSYNQHPRSYRYEGEEVLMFHGPAIGKAWQAVFDQDMQAAKRTRDLADVTVPQSDLFDMLEYFFFDQL